MKTVSLLPTFKAYFVLPAVVLFLAASGHGFGQAERCLPPDVSIDTPVTISKEAGNTFTVTVADKLKKLGAKCRNKKLQTRAGREIRFFHLEGCWGNPPADYLSILDEQRKKITTFKRRYTVIELTCETDGPDRP